MVLEIVLYYIGFYRLENALNRVLAQFGYYSISKHDLCLYEEQNTKATQVDIVAYFSKQRGVLPLATLLRVTFRRKRLSGPLAKRTAVQHLPNTLQWRLRYTDGSPTLEHADCLFPVIQESRIPYRGRLASRLNANQPTMTD